MSWVVVGANRETITAVVQTLVAHGFRAVAHQLFHLPATLEHLRQTAYHAVIFLCDGRVCSPARNAQPDSRTRLHASAERYGQGTAGRPACCNARHASCVGDCLLRQLRAAGIRVPVIVIAPRGSADTWTGCHEAGANDYLAALPADPVLLAHVQALMRHSSSQSAVHSSQLKVADLTLNTTTRVACRGGKKPQKLSPREAQLLEFLMRNKGKCYSRQQLVEQAWGEEYKPGSNIVNTNINRIREAVDADPSTRVIHTVRGTGYVVKGEG